MLRVVLDPGVLVSAVVAPSGPPGDLLVAWRDGLIEVVVSARLLDELSEVPQRPKFGRDVSPEEAADYVLSVERQAIVVEDAEHEPGLTPDPKDDYLVALARREDALLISGDKHLTPLSGVLTPRQLVDALQPE